jgi:zinc/manganese transport system substrate-binding protein
MVRLVFIAFLSLFLSPVWAQERLPVVASFSILGDLVQQIGGDRVSVTTLVGPNADAHGYQPKPNDAKAVAQARLIFVNGLGFDPWMQRLQKSSGSKAPIIVVSTNLVPLKESGKGHAHHGHNHGPVDPHAWHDVANLKLYAANIRDALSKADPAGSAYFNARLAHYDTALTALDQDIRTAIATIPPERRKIVTGHDAFGYFARAYGVVFLSPQGVSTETQPSAQDIARIIRFIRETKAPAVFIETISDPRQMDRIAQESGAKIGGKLYSDALSPPDGPAGTTIDMIRTNIREMTKALAPAS